MVRGRLSRNFQTRLDVARCSGVLFYLLDGYLLRRKGSITMFRISKIIYTFFRRRCDLRRLSFCPTSPRHGTQGIFTRWPEITRASTPLRPQSRVQLKPDTGNLISGINAYNGAGIKAPASWRSAGKPYIKVLSGERGRQIYNANHISVLFFSGRISPGLQRKKSSRIIHPAAHRAQTTCGDISPVYIMDGSDPGQRTINIILKNWQKKQCS